MSRHEAAQKSHMEVSQHRCFSVAAALQIKEEYAVVGVCSVEDRDVDLGSQVPSYQEMFAFYQIRFQLRWDASGSGV